jgi:hypothetical protein
VLRRAGAARAEELRVMESVADVWGFRLLERRALGAEALAGWRRAVRGGAVARRAVARLLSGAAAAAFDRSSPPPAPLAHGEAPPF